MNHDADHSSKVHKKGAWTDAELEALLQATLVPVKPRAEFVSGLRGRLVDPEAEVRPAPNLFRFLVYSGAGLLIVIAGVRSAPRLKGMLQNMRRPAAVETAAPVTQVA